MLDDISRIYTRDIIDTGKQVHFVILLSFLIAFIIVRVITHRIRRSSGSHIHNISARGVHIHHLVWGILLLLVTGYVAIAFDPARGHKLLAILYGIGTALTLDEFALWLDLRDVYWAKEGRTSIDAVVITTVILTMAVLGTQFWIDIARHIA